VRSLFHDVSKTSPRRLRKLLTFQVNSKPRDESGGYGEDWSTAFTVRGSLEPFSGEEVMPVDWTVSLNQFRAVIYRRPDVTTQMRILMFGVPDELLDQKTADITRAGYRAFLVIVAPQISAEDRFMEVYCEEVKS